MEIKNFKRLIHLIQEKPEFLSELPRYEQQYLVKIYKITELKVSNVIELFTIMQKKFYLHRKTSNEESWYQNELRIFIWLLFGYLFVFDKQLEQLNEEDWNFFSAIFNYKSTIFFQFQSISMIRPTGRPTPWSEDQTALLEIIINEKDHKNRWNSIARELYIRSGKRFFRNPKQCRERWMNHLDPSKIHTEWTVAEDLTLLNCIKKRGKRWSVAMKELANTRTQHMVKNRYKSLVSNQAKKYPGKREVQLENFLIKKLSKLIEKQNKDSSKSVDKEESEGNIQKQGIQIKCEMKEEKVETPLASKIGIKEDALRLQNQQIDFGLIQKMGGEFNDFQVHSPMFIPWHEDERKHRFDIDDDPSRNENHFCSPMEPFNSDDLSF